MTALARITAATEPPDRDAPIVICRCTAAYLDYPLGRDAHEVVFGHQPS